MDITMVTLADSFSQVVIKFVWVSPTYLVLHDLPAAPTLQYCLALVVAGTGSSSATAKVATTSQPPSSARDAPLASPQRSHVECKKYSIFAAFLYLFRHSLLSVLCNIL